MTLKRYCLREYGAWSVLLFGFLAGFLVALKKAQFNSSIFILFLSLCILVNSKQAFVTGFRLKDGEAYFIFAGQIILGLLLLFFTPGFDIMKLYPFAIFPLLYMILIVFSGEHAFFTEIMGFFVLSLSSLLIYFVMTEQINMKLYLSVAIFFAAGVFKVRIQLKKGFKEKIGMILYVAFSIIFFLIIKLNPLCLLPLIDNLIFSFTPYKINLKTIGWTEVLKGFIFLVLIYFLW